MKTILFLVALVLAMGLFGTPDYVRDVEQENAHLRRMVAQYRADRTECRALVATVAGDDLWGGEK